MIEPRDEECIWPVGGSTCGKWGAIVRDFHTHDETCDQQDPDHKPDAQCHPLTLPPEAD